MLNETETPEGIVDWSSQKLVQVNYNYFYDDFELMLKRPSKILKLSLSYAHYFPLHL